MCDPLALRILATPKESRSLWLSTKGRSSGLTTPRATDSSDAKTGRMYSSIQLDGYKTLKEGDDVEFDIVQGQKGPQADAVVRFKDTAHTAA